MRVIIRPTKFVSLDLEGNEAGVDYGFIVKDDYDIAYGGGFPADYLKGKTLEEIVAMAESIGGEAPAIIVTARNEGLGLHIADNHFDWDEIRDNRRRDGEAPDSSTFSPA